MQQPTRKDEIFSIYPNVKVSIIPNGIEYDKFQISNLYQKENMSKNLQIKILNQINSCELWEDFKRKKALIF